MAELIKSLRSATNLHDTMQMLASYVLPATGADRCSITLLTPDGLNFEMYGLSGVMGSAPHFMTQEAVQNSSIGRAAQGTLQKVPDTRLSEDLDAIYLAQNGILSFVNAPLDWDGKSRGSLNIGYKIVAGYNSEIVDLLCDFANVASTFLESRLLVNRAEIAKVELEDQAYRLKIINEVGKHLSKPSNEKTVVKLLNQTLEQILDIDKICLCICYEQEQKTWYIEDDFIKILTTQSDFIQKALIEDDVSLFTDLGTHSDPYINQLAGAGNQSMLVVSMFIPPNTPGALIITSLETTNFCNEDIAMLSHIANFVSSTLSNSYALEAAKLARIKADSANKAKDDFLAHISHEIRTPTTGIIGSSKLLAEQNTLTELQKDILDTIQSCGTSLLELVNEVLDLSKLEAGAIELEHQPIDLYELIDMAIDIVNIQAQDKNVPVFISINKNVQRFILGDEIRLKQILVNLLANAIKFTQQGFVLLHVRLRQHYRYEFVVLDSGLGMSVEQKAKIGQPYVQADSSTTRRFGGTGLGLSIVKGLTQAMQGELRIRSKKEKGSIFVARVCLKPAPQNNFETSDNFPTIEVQTSDIQLKVLLENQLVSLKAERAKENSDISINVESTNTIVVRDHRAPKSVKYYKLPIKIKTTNRILDGSHKSTITKTFHHTQHTNQTSDSALILVVDDHLINRKLFTRIVNRMGFKADSAQDGLEALKLVTENKYSYIFLDLHMPHLDGFETAKRIKEIYNVDTQQKAPLIFALTADQLTSKRLEQLNQIGMDGYLCKPVSSAELATILDTTTNYETK